MKKYTLLVLALFGVVLITQAQEDKYLWLEEVDGYYGWKQRWIISWCCIYTKT
ncbi:MAG: hypothetical protein ACJATI_003234 [Halioglobus sp.]|jgi:hypothetical protein